MFPLFCAPLCLLALILLASLPASAQIPSPQSALGFHPTDDKTIADWGQITDYFAKLDKASKRVTVKEIGRSTLGKPLIVAFISSESNIKKLEKYRQISAKLADPRTIDSDDDLADLIKNGKTIVSISCSIHSTEIVASQMSMNLAYELASAKDSDTKEILDNTILLLIPSPNPDGIDIVADWYRKTLGTKSEGTSPPELYHFYAGHDDNRDWFMLNLRETQAVTNLFWREWFPQIVYDIHQQGRFGPRFSIPPFFDPSNPRISPLILRDVGLIGYKMATDLQAGGISGIATNSAYDTWWHGGFRSAPYFHNSIGILSEAASARIMSPLDVTNDDLKRDPAVRGLSSVLESSTNFPAPWEGGLWSPADINRMELSASRSVLTLAAKFRKGYLQKFYEYGKTNLAPKAEDPRGFIVTAGQSNTETVSRFLEILMAQGVEVHQMTKELHIKAAKTDRDMHEVPLGSFLVFVNQPQKNNVLSLFEKQEYPHRLLPNGEAEPPYDVAGWTLPLQMGLEYETAWTIANLDRDRPTLKRVENIDQARSVLNLAPAGEPFEKKPYPLKTNPKVGVYKGFTGSMDEGWTRFMFDTFQIPFRSVSDKDIRLGNLDVDALILPSDSEKEIINGLSGDKYPSEFADGITEAGVVSLKRYVEQGGKLICFDESCAMVIKRFNLPIKNVLAGLKRSEFYDPGSIVQLDVDTRQPLARGLRRNTAAYFINSSAFDISDNKSVKSIARYTTGDSLLSGWMLGEKHLNGKTALAEASYGKGKIVLFAFRPQHRGQTWATFPFIFNALEK